MGMQRNKNAFYRLKQFLTSYHVEAILGRRQNTSRGWNDGNRETIGQKQNKGRGPNIAELGRGSVHLDTFNMITFQEKPTEMSTP